jgi:hypothetical protein
VDNVLYSRGLTKIEVGHNPLSTEEMLEITGLEAQITGLEETLFECPVCGWSGLTSNELEGVKQHKPHLFCVNCRLQKELIAHSGRRK